MTSTNYSILSAKVLCGEADYADFSALFPVYRREGRLMRPVTFLLKRDMQRAHVTIAALAAKMGVTQKRVRELREAERVPFLIALEYSEAIVSLAIAERSL